jgi:hypothetical protein
VPICPRVHCYSTLPPGRIRAAPSAYPPKLCNDLYRDRRTQEALLNGSAAIMGARNRRSADSMSQPVTLRCCAPATPDHHV